MIKLKPKIIFLLNSVDLNRGGLTHASLRQASTFAEAGYDTDILTFRHEPRFPVIRKQLVDMDKVSDKVSMRNLFHERALYGKHEKIRLNEMKVNMAKYAKAYTISKRKGYNAYRLYKDGVYEKYISLRKDDTLDFIDYFDADRHRLRREYYNYYGNVSCIQHFSLEENKVKQELFYDRNGQEVLNIWRHPAEQDIYRVISFGARGAISETDGDTVPYKLQWLEGVIRETDRPTVVISDTRSTDELLVRMEASLAKRLIRLHSNHLRNPDDPESELNMRNKYAITNIGRVDGLIVLTERQKSDITGRFGHSDKVHAIPNHYEEKAPKNIFEKIWKGFGRKRDMTKVVIVSRFSSVKNILHTIKAFKTVVEAVPEATLELWGKGAREDEYIKQIREMGLEECVFIKGYTNSPDKVYRSGAFTVVTSKAEGFSLSVMESMVNHTPVVSYDIRYGPSDMITNGENGYLITKNDIGALAESMISMLQDPEKTREMGEQAGHTMREQFNLGNYRRKWFGLIGDLFKKDESRGGE